MKIEQIKPGDLNPAKYNPRKWEEKDIEEMTESIKRFGMVDPIIVNSSEKRKNIVIGGHFRLKIAKDIGLKTVPVIYVDLPSEKKEKELNLRLNKNKGRWDIELLKTFDMDMLLDVGFDDEIEGLFDDATELDDDGFDVVRAAKEIKIPETKKGEIIKLGRHTLMCGDSTNPEDVAKLMGGFGRTWSTRTLLTT